MGCGLQAAAVLSGPEVQEVWLLPATVAGPELHGVRWTAPEGGVCGQAPLSGSSVHTPASCPPPRTDTFTAASSGLQDVPTLHLRSAHRGAVVTNGFVPSPSSPS